MTETLEGCRESWGIETHTQALDGATRRGLQASDVSSFRDLIFFLVFPGFPTPFQGFGHPGLSRVNPPGFVIYAGEKEISCRYYPQKNDFENSMIGMTSYYGLAIS